MNIETLSRAPEARTYEPPAKSFTWRGDLQRRSFPDWLMGFNMNYNGHDMSLQIDLGGKTICIYEGDTICVDRKGVISVTYGSFIV